MRYHINELLKFIKQHDSSDIFKNQSNTQLRKYIRACLHKERFYFIFRGPLLVGFIEWYRIKDCQYLINSQRDNKFLNCNPSGKTIYVQNAVFHAGYLTLRVFKRFVRYHKNIDYVTWFRHKTKKFKVIKVKQY